MSNRNLVHSLTTRVYQFYLYSTTHFLNLVKNLTTRELKHFLVPYNSCPKVSSKFNHQGAQAFSFTL